MSDHTEADIREIFTDYGNEYGIGSPDEIERVREEDAPDDHVGYDGWIATWRRGEYSCQAGVTDTALNEFNEGQIGITVKRAAERMENDGYNIEVDL